MRVKSVDELAPQVQASARASLKAQRKPVASPSGCRWCDSGVELLIEADGKRWHTQDGRAVLVCEVQSPKQDARERKRSKYRNVKEQRHGITFESLWEADRYEELLRAERCGIITDLAVHQSFALCSPSPAGQLIRVAAYEADFVYWRDGKIVVEDAKSKGTRTKEVYRLKAKMFETEYGVALIEVERRKPRFGAPP